MICLPPIVLDLLGAYKASLDNIRSQIKNVKYGKIDFNRNLQYIEFDIGTRHFELPMIGETKDYVIGFGEEADKRIALRVLLSQGD